MKLVYLILLNFLGKCFAKSRSDLVSYIYKNYDTRVRPSKVYNQKVAVEFELSLTELLDVSEVNQKIETKVYLSQSWNDPRLTWNSSEFEGIEHIYLETNQIWIPELVLYNNADGDFAVSIRTKAKVYSNGKVEWNPPAILKTFCEIQVATFPFDTQNCTMKIGTWSQDGGVLDIVNLNENGMESKCLENMTDGNFCAKRKCNPPDISSYEENGEWKLLSQGCNKHYVKYLCCIKPYPDMTYYFVIRRRPLYLIINILFPTLLFSLLTSAVFYLPSDAGEKITLSISVLLSLIVFLLVVVEAIPSTAKGVPLLCQYIVFTMILVCLSIVITVIILNVHNRTPSTHQMSPRTKKIFMEYLPKFMISSTVKKKHPEEDNLKDAERKDHVFSNISDISGRNKKTEIFGCELQKAIDSVNYVADYFHDQHESQKKEDEWKYVAMVLDHFILYIFMAACFLGTVGIFASRLLELNREEECLKQNGEHCLEGGL